MFFEVLNSKVPVIPTVGFSRSLAYFASLKHPFCNGEKHLIVSFYLYWIDVLFFISISFLMSSFVLSPSPYIHHHFSSPAFSVLHFSSFCSQSALFVFAVYIVHLFRYSWGFIFHHSFSHLIWTFIEMRLSLSCLMMFSLLLVLSRKKRMPT